MVFKPFGVLTADDCLEWCTKAYWNLNEACDLVCGVNPRTGGDFRDKGNLVGETMNFVLDTVTRGMNSGVLDYDVVRTDSLNNGDIELGVNGDLRFKPLDFLMWAKKTGLCVNEDLFIAVSDPEAYSKKIMPAEDFVKLRPNQISKFLCQGIAMALWDSNPQMTIAEMANQRLILEKGGGSAFSEKTRREWVSDADPRPGKHKTGPKGKEEVQE